MAEKSPAKTWLITGCSSGFGRCIAEAALARGQRVVATARDVRMIADLESAGYTTLALDVTDQQSIRDAVSEAHKAMGSLDVIVNNAGYGLIGAVEECTDDQIRRSMETNYFGPLNVIRAVLPILRSQGNGHIVNISAAAALANYPGFGIYGGAKAAMELMSESLAAEVKSLGIKVTLVQPGPFRTDFIARGLEKGANTMPEYANSVGRFAGFLTSINGKQPGDPMKAAELIVDTVINCEAPLRLPLGKYMMKKMRDKVASLTREIERWDTAASATDYGA